VRESAAHEFVRECVRACVRACATVGAVPAAAMRSRQLEQHRQHSHQDTLPAAAVNTLPATAARHMVVGGVNCDTNALQKQNMQAQRHCMTAGTLLLALCPASILSSSDSAVAFARPLVLPHRPSLSLSTFRGRLSSSPRVQNRPRVAVCGGRECRPGLRCATPDSETVSLLDWESEEESGEQGHGPQVYETHMEDAVYCGAKKIEFLRAAFGTFDDILEVPVLRAVPVTADAALSNADELRGKIAVVLRGSSTAAACSFVEKAVRVAEAHNFSKVRSIVDVHSNYTRALTCENFAGIASSNVLSIVALQQEMYQLYQLIDLLLRICARRAPWEWCWSTPKTR
jgi:hypothetical protein